MKISGKIQDKNINSIKLNNYWIKFFNKELIENANINDEVEIEYKDKEKDGKLYHNGISIKSIKSEINIQKPKIDNTTLNTIIMCSKDITIQSMQLGLDYDFNKIFNEIYKSITKI